MCGWDVTDGYEGGRVGGGSEEAGADEGEGLDD